MSFFLSRSWSALLTPPRADQEELIDGLDPSHTDFRESFTDVARINRYLGGTRAVLSALPPLIAQVPASRPLRVLDIATGSADIPRSLVQAVRAGRYGQDRTIEITALDNHPKVLEFARASTPTEAYPEIRLVTGDAFALAFADDTFDIVLCSLATHHFGYEKTVCLMREMERVSGSGWIINDLIRDRIGCFLAWLVTRLVGANRLTKNDAPLSVLRSYTLAEYKQMCRDAGLYDCTVHVAPMYRAVVRHVREAPRS